MPDVQNSIGHDQRDDLRHRIIARAEELFLANGYSTTTAKHLADSLGISKKTLYRVFGSKEDILYAVVLRITQSVTARSEVLFANRSRPPRERIWDLMSLLTAQYARLRMPGVLDDIRRNAPVVWAMFQEWRRNGVDRFEELLREGIACHDVRNDVPLTEMISVYHAMVNACMEVIITSDGAIPPERICATYMEVFFHGILPEPRLRTP